MLFVKHGRKQHGSKLITSEGFSPGDLIYRISGHRITAQPTYQTIQISPDRHMDHLDVLAYLNHSCHPNAWIDTENLSVMAVRSIQAGEELTFFYPSTEWEMKQPFICACKAPECLGWIAGAKYLPPEILDHYRISPHILAMVHSSIHIRSGHGSEQILSETQPESICVV